MEDIFKILKHNFENKNISTNVIIPNIKTINNLSKNSPAFTDPKYLPFYYRLGCEIKPKSVIQIGSNMGLVGACFLKGCDTVENWTCIDINNNHTNIIKSNLLKKYYLSIKNLFIIDDIKKIELKEKYDLAFLTENLDHIFYDCLMYLWDNTKSNGVLVVDFIFEKNIDEIFKNFCEVKNLNPFLFNTRYGTGILVKR